MYGDSALGIVAIATLYGATPTNAKTHVRSMNPHVFRVVFRLQRGGRRPPPVPDYAANLPICQSA
ncbi:hypothetical protein BN931_1060 [Bifidobacterium animalis subsp. lactis CECT 8145]|nr:hypothetical protein BN931_1060 [Bifidobacterium animalis subsp. lactis CECT 8145]